MPQAEEAVAVSKFHPGSRWEEPWTESNLTMYDLHRKSRGLIDDENHRLAIPLKTLNAEFVCPICLHYMNKTTIVMECLHRFCGECIQKCLRLGKKECPSYRTHIPSRRSLRADPAFDKLLRNILGDIKVLEAREVEQAKVAREQSRAMAESRKRGIVFQISQRNIKRATRASEAETEAEIETEADHPSQLEESDDSNVFADQDLPETGPALKTEKGLELEHSPLVDFVLQRHPQESELDRLKREWIRLNEEATVAVLQKFLSQKLSGGKHRYKPNEIEIFCRYEGRFVVLDEPVTLRMVRSMCNKESNLVLQYKLAG